MPRTARRIRLPRVTGAAAPIIVTGITLMLALEVWTVVAAVSSPWFFPSPWATAMAAADLIASGDLPDAVAISYFRILSG